MQVRVKQREECRVRQPCAWCQVGDVPTFSRSPCGATSTVDTWALGLSASALGPGVPWNPWTRGGAWGLVVSAPGLPRGRSACFFLSLRGRPQRRHTHSWAEAVRSGADSMPRGVQLR